MLAHIYVTFSLGGNVHLEIIHCCLKQLLLGLTLDSIEKPGAPYLWKIIELIKLLNFPNQNLILM